MCVRKLTVIFLVLCLACSSVWAIAGTKTRTQDAALVTEGMQNSGNGAEKTSMTLDEMLTVLANSGFAIGGSKLQEVKDGVAKVSQDMEDQNARIEELKGQLKKANSTKFFADFGVVLGFQNDLSYGMVGELGMKTKGVILKTGLQYTVGSTATGFDPSWNIQKMSVTATVGYEW